MDTRRLRKNRREQAVDQAAVIGVVHFGTVERDGGDPARVEGPQNGIG